MAAKKADTLRGTLDLMILRTLALAPMHGFGIAQRIVQISDGTIDASPGSVFPALYRLEQKGWIRGEWGVSENGRRARFYTLTARGRRQMQVERRNWDRVALAMQKILKATS